MTIIIFENVKRIGFVYAVYKWESPPFLLCVYSFYRRSCSLFFFVIRFRRIFFFLPLFRLTPYCSARSTVYSVSNKQIGKNVIRSCKYFSGYPGRVGVCGMFASCTLAYTCYSTMLFLSFIWGKIEKKRIEKKNNVEELRGRSRSEKVSHERAINMPPPPTPTPTPPLPLAESRYI